MKVNFDIRYSLLDILRFSFSLGRPGSSGAGLKPVAVLSSHTAKRCSDDKR